MKVIIALTDIADVAETAARIRAVGFQVDSTLEAIGVVTATGPETAIDRLLDIAGIRSVERDGAVSPS